MRKSVFHRILALVLCIALPLQLIPAAAEAGLSVSVSYTCSAPEPCVGSVLTFSLTGVGTVDYCVMIVEPDSMQTFLYGAQSTYTITKAGMHIIIAYGTNNTDPTAPGFARCMSEAIMITAAEGELPPEEPGELLWFFEPLSNTLHVYSTQGSFWTDAGWSDLVIAEGESGPDLSTLRVVDESFSHQIGDNITLWYHEMYVGYVDQLGMEIGKTYHLAVLPNGGSVTEETEFFTFTYDPGYIIFRPAEHGWLDLWGEEDVEIAWYPMEDAARYDIRITMTFELPDDSVQTIELPMGSVSADSIWPDGVMRLVIMKEYFRQAIPRELQLYEGTMSINIDAYSE